jgi:hypothetical protein
MVQSPFRSYWDSALASVDRQLVVANLTCADTSIRDHSSPVSLGSIRKLLQRVPPLVTPHDTAPNRDTGHKIDPNDPLFQESLQWLQEEIIDLLPSHASEHERSEVIRILKLSAELTALHFGTITEGWDRLVLIKQQLLLPNNSILARAAWIVSLMADFERSLRDAICLPIEWLGRVEPIREATSQMIVEKGIGLEPSSIMTYSRTESAVAQAISQSMAEGVTKTLDIASSFADYLVIKGLEGDSFKQGFHLELEEWGTTSLDIILKLVDFRRDVLHGTSSVGNSVGNHLHPKSNLALLQTCDFEKLQVVAQFLYSYSIHYSLGVMDVVSRKLVDGARTAKMAKVARYKAAAELHVGTLGLLKDKLWWLAWSLSDYVRVHYEGKDGLMLQLNAAFAQKKINTPGWVEKAREIKIAKNAAPRYHLLKKCILGEWSGIAQIITKALQGGDMTLRELASWPALEQLRTTKEYDKAIAKFGEPLV